MDNTIQQKRRPVSDEKKVKETPTFRNPEDLMLFPEIELKIKDFVLNLKSLLNDEYNGKDNCQDALDEHSNSSFTPSVSQTDQIHKGNRSQLRAIKRQLMIDQLLQNSSTEPIIKLNEKPYAKSSQEKNTLIRDLLQKDKPISLFVKEVEDYIFIIFIQGVTFTLLALENSDENPIINVSPEVHFLSQLKLQFQVIYQDQAHSQKFTCCESTFYYPSLATNPSLCFLLGGDIGEIFILKDDGAASFEVQRRQICTGQIQQIIIADANSHFLQENVCLILSQLEHIYLVNFASGIIIAQFGNQGSSGPGCFLSISWHPSYQFFCSSRENGGIELWKIDSDIVNHIQLASCTTKPPGKFFRKYIDVTPPQNTFEITFHFYKKMAYYFNWGIHPNQTGALVYASLMEHILLTIDNNMVLRFTLLEIKNSESHVNIMTIDLQFSSSDLVNVFTHNMQLFIVTKSKVFVFCLSEKESNPIEVIQLIYQPALFDYLYITKDFKYSIGLKERNLYISNQTFSSQTI